VPRPPDKKSKWLRIQVMPRNEEEAELARGFREVCIRDSLQMTDEVFKWLRTWLQAHNWPPGNPQQPLTKFSVKEPKPLPPNWCETHREWLCPDHIRLHALKWGCRVVHRSGMPEAVHCAGDQGFCREKVLK